MRYPVLALGVLSVVVSSPVGAVYNANTDGIVSQIVTYSDSSSIYFRLQNQPTSHPGCNPTFFVLSSTSVTNERMNRLFAQLLTSKTTGTSIAIGYDDAGDCAEGYIRAHRVG